ncbi:MAG: type III pantothenate kinase [bacterium]|nr:type III pantothenate kinase [Candidatus Limimorpha caballi]MCQ2315406.1 type III pantothenate kinase [Bacteroidales bacterium]
MSNALTIDIGNTRSKYAVFEGENIVRRGVFDPLYDDLSNLLLKYPGINRGIISSVGGKVDYCLAQLRGIETIVLTSDTPLPFKVQPAARGQIGSDRLAVVAEAYALKPHQNSLIIDVGTCITYDILTCDDEQLCGPISPGIKLRFKAMHEHTSLLPLLDPSNMEPKLLCENTKECLQSGVTFGVVSEIKEFINAYSNIFNDLNVFISGGDNIFLENKLKNCIFANSNFLFNGLRYILEYNENQQVK